MNDHWRGHQMQPEGLVAVCPFAQWILAIKVEGEAKTGEPNEEQPDIEQVAEKIFIKHGKQQKTQQSRQ